MREKRHMQNLYGLEVNWTSHLYFIILVFCLGSIQNTVVWLLFFNDFTYIAANTCRKDTFFNEEVKGDVRCLPERCDCKGERGCFLRLNAFTFNVTAWELGRGTGSSGWIFSQLVPASYTMLQCPEGDLLPPSHLRVLITPLLHHIGYW